jgi:dolichol-phosphate mannosyltransferase
MDMGFYHGLENSMNAGVDYASGDFVFEFDSLNVDYDFSLVIDVYNRCLQGYDIVGAAPQGKSRASSRLFYLLFNKHSKTQHPLMTESFRILSRRAINRIKQMNVALPYRKVVYANCGLKVDSISYAPNPGVAAVNNAELAYRGSVAFDSFFIFTDLAGKVSIALTFIMLVFSIFAGAYTFAVFISSQPVAGWTTTMLVLSFGFFGMFAILSMVIKYLSVILSLIFKKIKYVIGNIERL